MPFIILVDNGRNEVHLCDTKEQVVSALFKGNPPEGMTFDQIKHVTGAVVTPVTKFIDHR